MNAHWKRLAGFAPSYVKSPIRLNLLLMVAGIAALVVLERETFSIHGLLVAAAVVLATGCLIYTPPRLLLMFALLALSYEASRASGGRYMMALLIVLGCGCIAWCIDNTGNLILRRLDTLEEKLGEIESKQDGLQ